MNAHEPSGLEKYTWTEADFSLMGWHDAKVHAISVGENEDGQFPPGRLLLDLDYIVRWVDPVLPSPYFSFWIAPATLVFETWDIEGELEPAVNLLEIADLHRLDSPDHLPYLLWHIDGQNFDLRIRATGYTQYFRREPQHVSHQHLTMAQRGGLSFAEVSFA
ncbi:hypothetical protein E1263_36435 [Kribbella antibiotica]|uniref:Uncharacterized protein n=1 Tax=Kribbella antibiotica TaxID=190195 RepID=A0A4R4YN76_9ACTN|nr:hypothetical protein [Kribbella antibiotica]TDD46491.1 hypothetical protein E1263_36435 [Kribbella antibiotica]